MAALLRLSVWVAAFAAAIGDQSTACSPDAPLTVVAAAVSGHESEESLVSAGGCEVADDEEACLCAALSLKWAAVLRSGLRKRLLSKQPAARVRAFAQATHDSAVAILARLHHKYPASVKFLPAVEWAQTADVISVRVRYGRYTRGEALFQRIDGTPAVRLSDDECYHAAEGLEKPHFAETTLRWRGLLKRRDGCADQEEGCARWASEGACTDPPARGAPDWKQRCPRSCMYSLYPS